MLRSPALIKRYAGTVGMTSIGADLGGTFWGIWLPIHSLAVVVGGVAESISGWRLMRSGCR